MEPLVSIIMPTYNAEAFIGAAIESVLAQEYSNWELLIVNDASTDGTAEVMAKYSDPRIHRFHQARNSGIGSARNRGLDELKGNIICTFDSDDVLPPKSISARVSLLHERPEVDIVDGVVVVFDRFMERLLRTYHPAFEGEPLSELISLSGTCFFGPSWMLRWHPSNKLRFRTDVTHAEDLIFYLEYSKGKRYTALDSEVLHYRVTGQSAMSKLDGLERSYRYIARMLSQRPDLADKEQARAFDKRWRGIMFRTWLKQMKPLAACRALFT
ncbi:MAG: glycosyltransferase [Flavobacteriales bacterium]|nr:glycosyltransferase [Flavobacteriales bacterium]